MGGFRNALEAGGRLVKDVFSSPDFESGFSGWALFRNGNAELNNLTARGDIIVSANSEQSVPRSVADTLTVLLVAGNSTRNQLMNTTTTAAAIPGVQMAGNFTLYSDLLAALTASNAANQYNVQMIVTVDFASTSATGSGGHFQLRYKNSRGNVASYFAQMRSGQDDGHTSLTIQWQDFWNATTLQNAINTDDSLGSLWVRHTGSTAYLVTSVTVTTVWAPIV